MTSTSLPMFPNGKGHVSYSEIMDWKECSFRHKLKHIKKINLDGGSIHTAFGTAIHAAAEKYAVTRVMPESKEIMAIFRDGLKELPEEAQSKALKILPEFRENLPDMIGQIPEWLDETFPGWELVEAEKLLREPIEDQDNLKFKGFIDCVLRIEKKPTKKLLKECADKGETCPVQHEYWILDWKTCSWGWKTDQKRSPDKQMQLILYKHFFCQNTGIPLKQVKTAFVLIKRHMKKERTPGDRIELVPVSVGPAAIDNSLKVLHNMINQVRLGYTTKNRRYCKPFCPYLNTSHCP